jgi:hypothetical protein
MGLTSIWFNLTLAPLLEGKGLGVRSKFGKSAQVDLTGLVLYLLAISH